MERIIWLGPYETREETEKAAADFVHENKGEVVVPAYYIDVDTFYFSAVKKEDLYKVDNIITSAYSDALLNRMNMSFSHVPSEQGTYMRAFNKFLQVVDEAKMEFWK